MIEASQRARVLAVRTRGSHALAVSCLASLLAAGCGHTANFEDDIEVVLNIGAGKFPFSSTVDILHSPYVIGAQFSVYVLDNGDLNSRNLADWTFESSSPAVIHVVGGSSPPVVDLAAVGAGTTSFIVRDASGQIVGTHTVEVAVPDSAVVQANAWRLIGRSDSDSTVDGARVLIGGTASFMVEWFARKELLSGSRALSVHDAGTASVDTMQLPWSPVRDWFKVSPTDSTPVELRLSAGSADVRSFVVLPTASTEVASVALVGDSENGARTGDGLRLLGQAYDSEDQTILGVDFDWQVFGSSSGRGDCLVYAFDPPTPAALTATAFNLSTSLAIHPTNVQILSSNTTASAGAMIVASQALLSPHASPVAAAARSSERGGGR
jgi:hypothetical protein